MPAKPTVKISARVRAAKKARAAVVSKRMKDIAAGKRAGTRGRGLSREDLEALRDGRS